MDVKNKPTVLDDDAGIYQKREEKSEKQKFSELHGKEKLQYFKDYYFKILIGILLVLILAVYFIHTVWQSKKHTNFFYAAAVDQYFNEAVIEQLESSFGEYAGRTSEYETITFDTAYMISMNDYGTREKLQALIMVGDIDIFIAPESVFEQYASNGFMKPLDECLPTDLFSMLTDDFYFSTASENAGVEEVSGASEPYGLYVENTPFYKNTIAADEHIVLGIIVSGKNRENAIKFIRFLQNDFVPEITEEAD